MSEFNVLISLVLLFALASILTSETCLLSTKLSMKSVNDKLSLWNPLIRSNFSPYFFSILFKQATKFLLSFNLISMIIAPLPNLLRPNNSLFFLLLST